MISNVLSFEDYLFVTGSQNTVGDQELDLNRGILTPHLTVGTQSRSTYISRLISVQDKVLDTAVQALLKADAKDAASAESATVFPVGSYVICLMPIH